jgi:hypothetical protein
MFDSEAVVLAAKTTIARALSPKRCNHRFMVRFLSLVLTTAAVAG